MKMEYFAVPMGAKIWNDLPIYCSKQIIVSKLCTTAVFPVAVPKIFAYKITKDKNFFSIDGAKLRTNSLFIVFNLHRYSFISHTGRNSLLRNIIYI